MKKINKKKLKIRSNFDLLARHSQEKKEETSESHWAQIKKRMLFLTLNRDTCFHL